MEFTMKSIGIIHSPFNDRKQTPIQPTRSQATGWVEVFPQFLDGLQGLEEFSHIILLYVFHKSEGYTLIVKPFLDNQMHGLFTTRHPRRPNPIGLSTVQLLSRSDNILHIQGRCVGWHTPSRYQALFPRFRCTQRG